LIEAAQKTYRAKQWNIRRLLLTVLLATVIWVIVAALCVLVGSTGAIGWPGDRAFATRLWFRSERVLIASLVGAGLGMAGVVYQAILRNPLADPYLLGASSGASLLSIAWLVSMFGSSSTILFALGQQTAAFIGAILSVAAVLFAASSRGRIEPVTLILVGVIVNAVNGSFFLLIYSLHPEVVAQGGAFTFLIGGLQSSLSARQEWLAAACVLGGGIALMRISGLLNVAMLQTAEAESLGLNVQRLRWTGLVIASLVTASVVSISGPIGFIGLVTPHLARMVFGYDQRRLLPIATAFGACLLALADAASRFLSQQTLMQTELPVGVLTSLIGGPFFLVLLWRSRESQAETA